MTQMGCQLAVYSLKWHEGSTETEMPSGSLSSVYFLLFPIITLSREPRPNLVGCLGPSSEPCDFTRSQSMNNILSETLAFW